MSPCGIPQFSADLAYGLLSLPQGQRSETVVRVSLRDASPSGGEDARQSFQSGHASAASQDVVAEPRMQSAHPTALSKAAYCFSEFGVYDS